MAGDEEALDDDALEQHLDGMVAAMLAYADEHDLADETLVFAALTTGIRARMLSYAWNEDDATADGLRRALEAMREEFDQLIAGAKADAATFLDEFTGSEDEFAPGLPLDDSRTREP